MHFTKQERRYHDIAKQNKEVAQSWKRRCEELEKRVERQEATINQYEKHTHKMEVKIARLEEQLKYLKGELPTGQMPRERGARGGRSAVIDVEGRPVSEGDEEGEYREDELSEHVRELSSKSRELFELLRDGRKWTRQELADELDVDDPDTVTRRVAQLQSHPYFSETVNGEKSGKEKMYYFDG